MYEVAKHNGGVQLPLVSPERENNTLEHLTPPVAELGACVLPSQTEVSLPVAEAPTPSPEVLALVGRLVKRLDKTATLYSGGHIRRSLQRRDEPRAPSRHVMAALEVFASDPRVDVLPLEGTRALFRFFPQGRDSGDAHEFGVLETTLAAVIIDTEKRFPALNADGTPRTVDEFAADCRMKAKIALRNQSRSLDSPNWRTLRLLAEKHIFDQQRAAALVPAESIPTQRTALPLSEDPESNPGARQTQKQELSHDILIERLQKARTALTLEGPRVLRFEKLWRRVTGKGVVDPRHKARLADTLQDTGYLRVAPTGMYLLLPPEQRLAPEELKDFRLEVLNIYQAATRVVNAIVREGAVLTILDDRCVQMVEAACKGKGADLSGNLRRLVLDCVAAHPAMKRKEDDSGFKVQQKEKAVLKGQRVRGPQAFRGGGQRRASDISAKAAKRQGLAQIDGSNS